MRTAEKRCHLPVQLEIWETPSVQGPLCMSLLKILTATVSKRSKIVYTKIVLSYDKVVPTLSELPSHHDGYREEVQIHAFQTRHQICVVSVRQGRFILGKMAPGT